MGGTDGVPSSGCLSLRFRDPAQSQASGLEPHLLGQGLAKVTQVLSHSLEGREPNLASWETDGAGRG